jgi:hypothetical protein
MAVTPKPPIHTAAEACAFVVGRNPHRAVTFVGISEVSVQRTTINFGWRVEVHADRVYWDHSTLGDYPTQPQNDFLITFAGGNGEVSSEGECSCLRELPRASRTRVFGPGC